MCHMTREMYEAKFFFKLWHMDIKPFLVEDMVPLTNRVRGPYCKLWTELVADLWPKREESYCRNVSGYSTEKTDMTLCWKQMLC